MKSDTGKGDAEAFHKDFADLAAILHRVSPCVLGGQATTMMVPGGIGKGDALVAKAAGLTQRQQGHGRS